MKSAIIVILALGLALVQSDVEEPEPRWLDRPRTLGIMDTITIKVNNKQQRFFQSQEIISLLITLGPLSEMYRCYNKIHRC